MKADKPLDWEAKPDGFYGSNYTVYMAEGYTIGHYSHPREMTFRLEGNGLNVVRRYDVDGLKQLAQDHYNRNLRLKAWEDYMLANDPPSVLGG